MVRFIFRLAGMVALSVATIMAVLDVQRSIAASAPVLTPLGDSWEFAFPSTFAAVGAAAGKDGLALWREAIDALTSLPGFAVFVVLAFLLLLIGHRPQRPVSRPTT